MARARNIKPGFFKNELLVEMCTFDRLLFIGLWLLADREGRIEDRPKRIKLELFPCDTYDVDAGLNVLAGSGFVKRYTNNVKSVISIENFLRHQTPHGSEKDSELPDVDGNMTVNERDNNGYVNGKKRINNVKLCINVNSKSYNGASEVDSRHLPVETALNPESCILNPDILNKKDKPIGLVFPAWIPMEAWNGYSEMRKKLRKPMTDRAARLKFLDLQKFMDAGHDLTAILDKSTENSWLDLYEPKTKPKQDKNWAAKPAWVTQAGFADIADANAARCWQSNAAEFKDGKRLEPA